MRIEAVVIAVVLAMATWAFAGEENQSANAATRFDGMKIKATHPRIYLDEQIVKGLKGETKGKSVEEVRALTGQSAEGLALAYVITGDEKTGKEAIAKCKAAAGRRNTRTEAVIYDWCYPILSDADKSEMREDLIKAMKSAMATPRSWRSFHNSLYSTAVPVSFAAIAIYGDDPFAQEAFKFLNAEWEDVLRTFEFVFPDGAWGEGFDYNRHVSYEALRYFLALKTATGRDFIKESKHLQNTAYYILYATKANGLVLPEKDCDWPFLGSWDHDAMMMLATEYGNGYVQQFLVNCPVKREWPVEGRDLWKQLLWFSADASQKNPTDLPLSRIFRDDGLVMARSGWGWDSEKERANDTWMAFKCGNYYGDHAHCDNNSFEIYHKGELAIDSGRYDDDWGMEEDPKEIVKSEFFNYYQRTIAHNSVLVYDPDEKFECGVLNDGGQMELIRVNGVRNVPEDYDQGNFPSEGGKKGTCDWKTNPGRWDTGKIIAYKATKDFTYVCGDATKSYNPKKMKSFVRQFVFVQPNLFVVFDRVVSTKAEFKKTWLLHTVNEPKIAEGGSAFEATYGEGRVVCVPVLPEKRTLVKVGGPEDECMVAGVKFHYGPKASSGREAELHYGETPGAWRVEESPKAAAEEDYFLNVILVSDASSSETPSVKLGGESEKTITVDVATKDGTKASVSFARGEKPQATVKIVKGEKAVFDAQMPNGIILEDGRP